MYAALHRKKKSHKNQYDALLTLFGKHKLKESKHFECSVAAASDLKNCTVVNCDCEFIFFLQKLLTCFTFTFIYSHSPEALKDISCTTTHLLSYLKTNIHHGINLTPYIKEKINKCSVWNISIAY